MRKVFFLVFALALTSLSQAETSCEATYDILGIPHQKVSTEEGYYYCFGFHHGKDRAWEMDYFRRLAQGRNAEVLGFSQLKSDLMMRLLDIPSLAEKIWQTFPEDKKKVFDIYAEGVNEGFKLGKNSYEFTDIGYTPEKWTALDSLMVLLIQSFDQTRKTFFRDYEEEKYKQITKEWLESQSNLLV